MRELRNTKIIAVDHGYGNMKTANTNLPSYMMFPRFLLDMEINETAKMLYIILLPGKEITKVRNTKQTT